VSSDKKNISTISIIGLGYIGLPTAALFASRKLNVIGVDVNEKAIETINKGLIHFFEPDLDILVRSVVSEGYLRATKTPESANVFIIAVPTPFKENHEPDLSYIKSAATAIARVLEKGNLVILESTSPVGATEQLAQWLREVRPDLTFPQTHGDDSDIKIAYCPERVLPGHVLRELVQNDRIIGGMSSRCAEMAMDLYQLFVEGECKITNARTAEMCKLTENSFRDVNIAFANELSMICDKLNINVWELIQLANRHPRVNILQPGPGVGGHCIAVDPWFIVSSAPQESQLIRAARKVNDYKPFWVINKIQQAVDELNQRSPKKSNKEITIACFGLAFKPNIDDLRESPSLFIVEQIAEFHNGPLSVVEPNIAILPDSLKTKAMLMDQEMALIEADIVVLLVDHKVFKEIFKSLQPRQKLIDTRGVWTKM
jgi:UDP-N-acetyl-D-mannosaminuronic acid dehydrogenase